MPIEVGDAIIKIVADTTDLDKAAGAEAKVGRAAETMAADIGKGTSALSALATQAGKVSEATGAMAANAGKSAVSLSGVGNNARGAMDSFLGLCTVVKNPAPVEATKAWDILARELGIRTTAEVQKTIQKLQQLQAEMIKAKAPIGDLTRVTEQLSRAQAEYNSLAVVAPKTGTGVVPPKAAGLSMLGGIVQGTASSLGQGIISAAAGFGTFAVAQGVVMGAVGAVRDAKDAVLDFEKSWANVKTILGTSAEKTEELRKRILGLSTELGSAKALTEAYYEAVSSNIDPESAIGITETAAKLAKSTLADQGATLKVLISIIHSYGMEMKDANEIADVLFTTIKLGRVRGEELANSLGPIMPIASNLGVPLRELMALLASLTMGGLDFSEAVTGMRQAMLNFIAPTPEAKRVAGELGIEIGKSALKTKTFSEALFDMAKKVGTNTEAADALFGNIRALTAVLSLTGGQANNFAKFMKEIGDESLTAGSNSKAFEIQLTTLGEQLTRAGTIWDRFWQQTAGDTGPVAKSIRVVLDLVQELLLETGKLEEKAKGASAKGPIESKSSAKFDDNTNAFTPGGGKKEKSLVYEALKEDIADFWAGMLITAKQATPSGITNAQRLEQVALLRGAMGLQPHAGDPFAKTPQFLGATKEEKAKTDAWFLSITPKDPSPPPIDYGRANPLDKLREDYDPGVRAKQQERFNLMEEGLDKRKGIEAKYKVLIEKSIADYQNNSELQEKAVDKLSKARDEELAKLDAQEAKREDAIENLRKSLDGEYAARKEHAERLSVIAKMPDKKERQRYEIASDVKLLEDLEKIETAKANIKNKILKDAGLGDIKSMGNLQEQVSTLRGEYSRLLQQGQVYEQVQAFEAWRRKVMELSDAMRVSGVAASAWDANTSAFLDASWKNTARSVEEKMRSFMEIARAQGRVSTWDPKSTDWDAARPERYKLKPVEAPFISTLYTDTDKAQRTAYANFYGKGMKTQESAFDALGIGKTKAQWNMEVGQAQAALKTIEDAFFSGRVSQRHLENAELSALQVKVDAYRNSSGEITSIELKRYRDLSKAQKKADEDLEKSLEANRSSVERLSEIGNIFKEGMVNAVGSGFAAFITGQGSFGDAIKGMLAQLAQMWAVKSIGELADGIAALMNPLTAGQAPGYFKASALHAAAATAAGLASRAIPSGDSQGQGASGGTAYQRQEPRNSTGSMSYGNSPTPMTSLNYQAQMASDVASTWARQQAAVTVQRFGSGQLSSAPTMVHNHYNFDVKANDVKSFAEAMASPAGQKVILNTAVSGIRSNSQIRKLTQPRSTS